MTDFNLCNKLFYIKKWIDLKSKISVTEVKLKMVEEFIKALNNRNFTIKSAIEWHKLMNGVA